tara:strand:+ start:143 stop:523 length:381 start_codon:yes stop_codon:yes gene_type:complete
MEFHYDGSIKSLPPDNAHWVDEDGYHRITLQSFQEQGTPWGFDQLVLMEAMLLKKKPRRRINQIGTLLKFVGVSEEEALREGQVAVIVLDITFLTKDDSSSRTSLEEFKQAAQQNMKEISSKVHPL